MGKTSTRGWSVSVVVVKVNTRNNSKSQGANLDFQNALDSSRNETDEPEAIPSQHRKTFSLNVEEA